MEILTKDKVAQIRRNKHHSPKVVALCGSHELLRDAFNVAFAELEERRAKDEEKTDEPD